MATDLDAGMAQFVSHFAGREDPEHAPPVPKCEIRVCFCLYAECPRCSCYHICTVFSNQTL